jgi:phage major head subunit gpT-like protein
MYRLNGSYKFQKVGNAGELKMAQASDTKRSVSAETFGITTSLTRQDIINDDLSALSLIPQRIGRGAALSLNDVIWGEFASNNASYYQAASVSSSNALSFDSLATASTAYRKLTDPDGNPLGIQPKILLVPPELELAAARLMTSNLLIASALGSTSSKQLEPATNVLAGRFKVVVSNYLTSATTWWLMADAADLNALDVVFLNGVQVPTIEQVQADYQLLGVQMRGYMDFGVTKAESLSCYRMATA